jgi:lipoprotein-releasing system permease protein
MMRVSPYEWLIGTRYLRSTHRRGFVSFVSLMSVLGLMLGVATLVVVLSVMNGFSRELRARMLSVTAHAQLMGLQGTLTDWQSIQKEALRHEGVEAAVPYIEEQAMLANGDRLSGSLIRGVLPEEERRVTGLAQQLTAGRLEDLQPGQFHIILGAALAKELRAQVGGSVVLMAPEGTATPGGVVPRMRRFKVTGIFDSGVYEFDRSLALIHIRDAALLYHLGNAVTGVRLALRDPMQAHAAVQQIAYALGGNFYVSDWTLSHANFFRSIDITKSIMFVILLMAVGVAAFNIVATLVMIVKEKQTDIAILRTLGAGPRNVLLMFAIQGVVIGLAGTVLGALLGVLLSDNLQSIIDVLQKLIGVQFLDASVYLMDELPAYVEWGDLLKVCAVAFILCALATVYPAWRASRTQPAEALRHE